MRIVYKLLTIVANSDLSEEDKAFLGKHVSSLTDAEAGDLVGAFTKYPQALPAYVEYITQLKETGPRTPEQIEALLKTVLEKVQISP